MLLSKGIPLSNALAIPRFLLNRRQKPHLRADTPRLSGLFLDGSTMVPNMLRGSEEEAESTIDKSRAMARARALDLGYALLE